MEEKTTVLVKLPGQPLAYMNVPTTHIRDVHQSIPGFQSSEVDIFSLYRGFYYIIMDKDRVKKRLPANMTAYLVDTAGRTNVVDVQGTFAICKLPHGLTGPMGSMTPQDTQEVIKLLQK